MTAIAETLSFAGLALFALGLLNGFLIPLARSPRIGLSAHLTAVQSGTFLIVVGLLWPHIGVQARWEAPIAHTLWISLYALWLSLLLAAVLGAGRDLPIAGNGVRTGPVGQAVVSLMLVGGSIGTTLAVGALLAAWRV